MPTHNITLSHNSTSTNNNSPCPDYHLRLIQPADNPAIARVIRAVSAEHGLTADKGFAVADPILDSLYSVYSQPRSAYWVVEVAGEIVGGGGVSPLAGGDKYTCELQKIYLSSVVRGQGVAKKIVLMSLEFARQQGYQRCYLETTAQLQAAIKLYEKLGFETIDAPLGNTGHGDCEIRMLKTW
ncbi:GNAT family N-acetyltransferase [Moellerella wisconsensis]|uniref:GNAT family N-acetyltransferase n=1 Tax=Moellerella wisconsensis TaxID=158849 RepID=A0A9Q8Q1Y0_9GAMM|nr:GNAT family N-acetyltransferase [Moellerella wisconsensis]UNH30487.1 GNAT family N-acetyltransferase [Moellerella wisconsensis]